MITNDTAILFPSKLSGNLTVPTSKSYMQRVLALALLNPGETLIKNPGTSADDLAAINIIKSLGAILKFEGDQLLVKGVSILEANRIHAGESGLSLRMFTSIAALSADRISITGEGSLLQRPMNVFKEIFKSLNVDYDSNDGKLPLTVKGPLVPCDIKMDGSLSSQFLTGFLISLSYAAKEKITIFVSQLKSKPYINLTLSLLQKFGYEVVNNNYEEFNVIPNNKEAKDIECTVEGDWSGAAFLLVAAAIGGSITVSGLSISSEQADKKIMEALKDSKALVTIDGDNIKVERAALSSFTFDATDCPDLFPPLVALAACCSGMSTITGVSRLKHKESDRATALIQEFATLGVTIEVEDDVMHVIGTTIIAGGKVYSHDDHRIAMATAIMSTRSTGSIEIIGASAVNKSYPNFYEDLKKVGAKIKT